MDLDYLRELKGTGHGGNLFVVSVILVIIGSVILYTISQDGEFYRIAAAFAVALGLIAMMLFVAAIRRAVLRRRERLQLSRLSRDEWIKARSKLKSGFKPPPAKLPDTDLKY